SDRKLLDVGDADQCVDPLTRHEKAERMNVRLLKELQNAGFRSDEVALRHGAGDVANLQSIHVRSRTTHIENSDDGALLLNRHMVKTILRHPCLHRSNRLIRAASDKALSWRGDQPQAQTCLIV